MNQRDYKLDKTIVTASSFKEADNHIQYWENKTYLERLNAACFIINQIFGVSADTRVDRTVLTSRKHNNV